MLLGGHRFSAICLGDGRSQLCLLVCGDFERFIGLAGQHGHDRPLVEGRSFDDHLPPTTLPVATLMQSPRALPGWPRRPSLPAKNYNSVIDAILRLFAVAALLVSGAARWHYTYDERAPRSSRADWRR